MGHLLRLALVGAAASVAVGAGPSAALAVSLPVPSLPLPTVTAPAVTTPEVSVPAVSTPVATTPAVTVPPVSAPTVSAPGVTQTPVQVPAVSVPEVSTPVARVSGGGLGSSPQPASGSTLPDSGGSTSGGSTSGGGGGGETPSSGGTDDATGTAGPGAVASAPAGTRAAAGQSAATVAPVTGAAAVALSRASAALTASSLRSSSRVFSGSQEGLDEYLLGLVHDDLCASLASILGPLPPRIDGLPGPVIRQLPAEVRNVVPREVLARGTVRCEATLFDASIAHAEPDAKLLALLAQTGLMVMTFVQVGLGLLCIGALVRHHARPGLAS